MRMHDDQLDITGETVAALVAAQFPQWAGRPVRAVTSHGTVNALFRLGDDVVLRFPLRPADPAELAAEQENARLIAPHVSVAVPEPLGLGAPGAGCPGPWAAYRWIPGEPAGALADPEAFAGELARFVGELHAIGTGGRRGDGRGRGGPLRDSDDWVRKSLAESRHLTDTGRLARIWDRCREIPLPAAAATWIHGDLMPGNLLVRDGVLAAVIDLGTAGVGDPAVDLMPAWNLLGAPARAVFRESLRVDDPAWERGRGWALLQAIGSLWYYARTNPVMAATARHTLDAVLADAG